MTNPLPGVHLLRHAIDQALAQGANLYYENNHLRKIAEAKKEPFEDHPLLPVFNRPMDRDAQKQWDELLEFAHDRYHRDLDLTKLGDQILLWQEIEGLFRWANTDFEASRQWLAKMSLEHERKEKSLWHRFYRFWKKNWRVVVSWTHLRTSTERP
jgi:hypothetical protein